uniref:Cation-transporting P-type ATPase C-terminal domain-containing protein n=1 Tax=Fagus sylvatica TaxID=28930 RepID=A0A2N9IXR1_FAGSY
MCMVDGYARMLVTSVGMNTTRGEMMSSSKCNTNELQTHLQARLSKLSTSITAIVEVVIPKGFHLAVNLTHVYSMKKMMANQAMVQKLFACETMGFVTTISTDKTGTLTLNQMKVTKPTSGSEIKFLGSPTEKAILSWAVLELNMEMEQLAQSGKILYVEAFNSQKKRSGVMIRRKVDNSIHVHWKGAVEMILKMCSSYYDASGSMKNLDDGEKMKFEQIIQGLVDIKDPRRPGVKKVVEDCQSAGVNIKMIIGDDVFIEKAIATECGILRPSQDMISTGVVIEGEEFRNYTQEERMEKVDKIFTGDSTNDVPTLKEADIGLSMGIHGTEVAKESSDIVILDDNFTSVAKFLMWGRCVSKNIQKFIQFQLTANVVAVTVNSVAIILEALQGTDGKSTSGLDSTTYYQKYVEKCLSPSFLSDCSPLDLANQSSPKNAKLLMRLTTTLSSVNVF